MSPTFVAVSVEHCFYDAAADLFEECLRAPPQLLVVAFVIVAGARSLNPRMAGERQIKHGR